MSRISFSVSEAEVEQKLRCEQQRYSAIACKWGSTGFYPIMIFIVLVYNSDDWNALIND